MDIIHLSPHDRCHATPTYATPTTRSRRAPTAPVRSSVESAPPRSPRTSLRQMSEWLTIARKQSSSNSFPSVPSRQQHRVTTPPLARSHASPLETATESIEGRRSRRPPRLFRPIHNIDDCDTIRIRYVRPASSGHSTPRRREPSGRCEILFQHLFIAWAHCPGRVRA